MTALTARLDTHTTNPAFVRGLAIGVLTSLILAAAIVAAVLFATWRPAAGSTPGVQNPPAQIQVDQEHPIHRPGGVTVY